MHAWELRNPNTQDRVVEQLNNAIMGGIIFETVHYRRDGSSFPVEVNSVNTGKENIVISIIRDITERGEREYEIRKLAAIVEHSNDAIIGIDLEGIITSWNKGAERIYGHSKVEAIGSNVLILALPEKVEEIKNNVERAIKGVEINEFETMRKNKNGERIYVSLTTSTVKDNEDNIVGISIIARDITERKENELKLEEKYIELTEIYEELAAAEEELRQNCNDLEIMKDEADRANMAKSQFLANMSHEIRTPMNGIICIAELLSESELNEQQREYINMLHTSSKWLLEIINSILDISKIESGNFKLHKESFNLRDNIEKIVKELWPISQSKGIEIMYFIDPFINLDLIGDPLRLNQVLINLINNAIKFTERGHIFIRVSKITSKSNSTKLLFSVEDTGIGISDKFKNKLFKVFSQGDDSYTKKYGGTGLGLAISKEIINLMNGEIWAVSKEGEGSTFYFTVEFSINSNIMNSNSREDKANSELIASTKYNTSIATILVVDDNEINKKVASAFIIKKGYNCLCASNGKQAIEIFEKDNIDLILMDIQMPELNGFEATKIIRENEKSNESRIPIIAMTAYAMTGDRQKCINAGIDDYMSKPIEANELYKKIENYLGR
jgi:PAS domain S-box-containing protein